MTCHVSSMKSITVVGSLLIGLVKSFNPVVGAFRLHTVRGYLQLSELSGNEGEWVQEIMMEKCVSVCEEERLFS